MRIGEGTTLIAAAGLLYGFVTVGGSILASRGLSTLDISFFFLFISILPLAPLVLRDRLMLSKFRSNWKYLSLYSLVNSCLLFSQFGSLSLGLSPPTVAFLLYTQPVWTVVFGRTFFGERLSRARIFVILLALAGMVLVTDPFSIVGSQNVLGEVIAALGGIFLSLWIILGKKGRLGNIENPLELTFAVRASSSLPIGAISICSLFLGGGLFLSNIPALYSNLWLLIVFSIVAGILPDWLFYSGVDRVQSLNAGIILLLEPVSSAVLSALLMIASLSWLQLLGGAMILLSNYLVLRDSPIQK